MRALVISGVLVCAACSARSDLETSETSAGGGGATSASSTASATSGTTTSASGGAPPCQGFELDGEPYTIPVGMNATEPEVGVFGGANYVAFLTQDGFLSADLGLTPQTSWPDPFDAITPLIPEAGPFVLGPGASEPVGAMTNSDGWLTLLPWPLTQLQYTPIVSSAVPRSIAATADRTLLATLDFGLLQVWGIENTGFMSTEEPQVCLGTTSLIRIVPRGEFFLAAYADSLAAGQSCFSQVPQPGMNLVVRSYASASGPPSVIRAEFPQSEPLLHLGLERTSFGAWLVFQTDGSTSLTMPPFSAVRLGPTGERLSASEQPFAITPSGIWSPVIATATLGDALVFAWVDTLDPSAPTVVVQRIEPDGSTGPITSFPTNAAWLTGKLVMTGTPGGEALLLAWTADFDKTVGVAKIGCR